MPHRICSAHSTQLNSFLETKIPLSLVFKKVKRRYKEMEGDLISFQVDFRKLCWHNEHALDWS